MNLLVTLAAFAVALGLLVVVHELGHYWVARLSGVKVLRFSVGFGKVLYTRRVGADATEWAISAFPLGGYVKMLDEQEGEVAPEELHRAFNRQSVFKRFAIVFAGPASNLILAVLLYWVLFMHGVPGMKPILGEIAAGSSAAAAGFKSGETLTRVDGASVKTWEDVRWALLQHALGGSRAMIEVREDASGSLETRALELSAIKIDDPDLDLLRELGFSRYQPQIKAVIGGVAENKAAARAGIIPGDEIRAVDGRPVLHWEQLAETIRNSAGKRLRLSVARDGRQLDLTAIVDSVAEGGRTVGKLGIGPKIDRAAFENLFTEVRYGPIDAFGRAASKTWETAMFTLEMLGKMVVGEVSLKSIGGPLTIADYAGQSARIGLGAYLSFLALISISLGVLNLLPVPVLDGGHLMYYMAEIIRGRPLPQRVMEIGQQLGLALLFSLMAIAIYNDLHRLITG